MFKGSRILGFIAIVACSVSSQAFAQGAGCIVLKSVAEVEEATVNAKGEKSTKLVPLTKVVPGVEVTWTITANNICKKPSENVTINDAIPEHMTYVANSAVGPGSDILFTVDGKTFAPADQLTVVENGATRKARPDEYKAIRWNFKNSFAPGAQGFGRFRAILN